MLDQLSNAYGSDVYAGERLPAVLKFGDMSYPVEMTEPLGWLSGPESLGSLLPDESLADYDRMRGDWLKDFTMNLTLNAVDPDLIALLTGSPVTGHSFAVEVYTPARRRTFWEWLRRKPRHYASNTVIPNATIVSADEDDG